MASGLTISGNFLLELFGQLCDIFASSHCSSHLRVQSQYTLRSGSGAERMYIHEAGCYHEPHITLLLPTHG